MKKVILFSLLFSVALFAAPSSAEIRYYTAKDLDMSNVRDVRDKKKRFFDFMRPIVAAENARVLALREQLLEAKKNNNNKDFVAKVAEEYTVKDWTGSDANWKKLLERVDAVALEVVLAQSANESAWGQSRFAKEGNNFFGQWCYRKGCGIVPANRDKGARHEVAKFKSVNHSVRSYIKNINTGRVYAPLRQVRANDRAAGKAPSAYNQAGGLIKYSTRRAAYVKEIRSIIRVNGKLMRSA